MSLTAAIYGIKRTLDEPYPDADKLDNIKFYLPNIEEFGYKFSKKNLLIRIAEESGYKKFRLLSNINEGNNIFMWCDEEYNFIGMCPHKIDVEAQTFVVEYTIDELPDVIDKAESWLFGISKIAPHYQIINLEIMGV